jgi:hypothetical protein
MLIFAEDTVEQIIKQVLHLIQSTPQLANSVSLPFKTPEGYELRLLDDDMPMFDIAPFDRKLKFGTKPDPVAFCAKKDFAELAKRAIRTRQEANEIHMEKLTRGDNVRAFRDVPRNRCSKSICVQGPRGH